MIVARIAAARLRPELGAVGEPEYVAAMASRSQAAQLITAR